MSQAATRSAPGRDAPNICTYLTPEPQAGVHGIFFFFDCYCVTSVYAQRYLSPQPTPNAHTHALARLACLVIGTASVSAIRQLYHGQKKRGRRHIITCFLSTTKLDPDRTCEKKSIRRCCLGYALPLVFPASKNNTEEPEVGGSPPIGVSQLLERSV